MTYYKSYHKIKYQSEEKNKNHIIIFLLKSIVRIQHTILRNL